MSQVQVTTITVEEVKVGDHVAFIYEDELTLNKVNAFVWDSYSAMTTLYFAPVYDRVFILTVGAGSTFLRLTVVD